MTFSDIMALAKNGYKPADIKELLAIQTEPEQKEQPEQTEQMEQTEQTEQTEQPESKPEQTEQMQALTKQVEELQKQLLDTQSKLKTAQKANTQANVKIDSGQSDAERLNDWARSFM